MDCFICDLRLDTIRIMTHHFRFGHDMTENDIYICTFGGNCNQQLSNLRSFSRHVKGHMRIQDRNDVIDSSNDSNSEYSETSFDSSIPSVHSRQIDSPNHSENTDENTECDMPPPPIQLQLSQNHHSIEQNGIEFALNLHSNDNFTRKDVIQVQDIVMKNTVAPIVNKVEQYLNAHIAQEFDEDHEQRLLQTSLIENISNPFRACENEYQLLSWLSKNVYVRDFNEFIINKEIGEKFSRGEIRYEEVEITGVLLPLSFQFRKFFEKNDRLINTLKYIEDISNSSQSNSHFTHGSLWRQKRQTFVEANQIVLPFFYTLMTRKSIILLGHTQIQ